MVTLPVCVRTNCEWLASGAALALSEMEGMAM
jgi:hypothetical protein